MVIFETSTQETWISAQWTAALAHCPFIYSVRTDEYGNIQEANIEFARSIGITPSELKNRNFAEVLGVRSLSDTIVGQALIQRRAVYGPTSTQSHPDQCEAWAFPFARGGKIVAVKYLAAPRKSRRPNRPIPAEIAPPIDHLKRFAAIAAHEIDNALSAITATAQLLQSVQPDPKTVARLASRIQTSVKQASQIITDLKVLAAPVKRSEIVHINSIIAELVETRAAEAARLGVTIQSKCADNIPPLFCDRSRLRQVIINLIKNGIEAIAALVEKEGTSTNSQDTQHFDQPRRCLLIKTRRGRGDTVVITIYNQGIPIPPEMKERLFEPFFSTKPDGTGLGLPICKEIVENHEGTLTFRSTARLGTAFRIILPAYRGPG